MPTLFLTARCSSLTEEYQRGICQPAYSPTFAWSLCHSKSFSCFMLYLMVSSFKCFRSHIFRVDTPGPGHKMFTYTKVNTV